MISSARIGFFIILGATILMLYSCINTGGTVPEPVPRDTSITSENSYTNQFIDSMMVEQFLRNEYINDTTAQNIRNFYNKRNYSYAWFTDTGFTIQAQAFWSIHDDYARYAGDTTFFQRRLYAVMDSLVNADTLSIDPDTMAITELRLTAYFFDFTKNAFGAKADPEELQWHIPSRQLKVEDLLDSLLSSQGKLWQPLNRHYHRMHNAILLYNNMYQQGEWDSIQKPAATLRPGDQHITIQQVKKRLALLKKFPAEDTTDVFTDSLATQVARLRKSYGLDERKIIDSSLINRMNVPVETRIRQMLINLERFKWLPQQPERFIFVNIPDYSLLVTDSGRPTIRMKVVVGKAANRTVIFSGELKYIVFSPYWNVPKSIVRNELVPAMNRSSTYLDRNSYEITGYSSGLPVIRQKPGPDNALGKVKFLFPNEYNIYLHDTNARDLFSRSKRAFSHGCIRIEKPFELTRYLLGNDTAWTEQRIRKAMNNEKESWVTLKSPIKVFILYITSWVDNEGWVNFRDDVYLHDRNMAKVLFK